MWYKTTHIWNFPLCMCFWQFTSFPLLFLYCLKLRRRTIITNETTILNKHSELTWSLTCHGVNYISYIESISSSVMKNMLKTDYLSENSEDHNTTKIILTEQNLICNLLWLNYIANIKSISLSMTKKGADKLNIKSISSSTKKKVENWFTGLTDGEYKPKIPFNFVSREQKMTKCRRKKGNHDHRTAYNNKQNQNCMETKLKKPFVTFTLVFLCGILRDRSSVSTNKLKHNLLFFLLLAHILFGGIWF